MLKELRKLEMGLGLARLAAVGAAQAQPAATVLPPVYRFNLLEQPLVLPNARFYIAEVLDLRPNPAFVGWVQVGMTNVRVPADLQGGAASGLRHWLQAALPARPGARPVVVRIHDLRIEEVTGSVAEKATATTDLEFLVQQPDSAFYQLLRATETEPHRGLETTEFHDDNLAACIRRSLTELNAMDWDERLRHARPLAPATLAYRNGVRPEPLSYPILRAAAPARGLYPDFLAFRRNAPSTAAAFRVEPMPTKSSGQAFAESRPVATAGQKELPESWGFSDGERAYIRVGRHYYPLQRVGDDYAFMGRAGVDPGAVSTAAVLGGVVGAAVAGAATSGIWQEYRLDIRDGRVSDYAYWDQASARDTAQVFIYRRDAKYAAPVTVLLGGKEVFALQAKELRTLTWTSKTREMPLAVAGPQPTSLDLIPDFTQPLYFQLKPSQADPAQFELVPIKAREGEFMVKRLRNKPVGIQRKSFEDEW